MSSFRAGQKNFVHGDLKSRLVWISDSQKEAGLQVVWILNGIWNMEAQQFEIRTRGRHFFNNWISNGPVFKWLGRRAKAQTFEDWTIWNPTFKSSDFKCLWISNGRISDPHCTGIIWILNMFGSRIGSNPASWGMFQILNVIRTPNNVVWNSDKFSLNHVNIQIWLAWNVLYTHILLLAKTYEHQRLMWDFCIMRRWTTIVWPLSTIKTESRLRHTRSCSGTP